MSGHVPERSQAGRQTQEQATRRDDGTRKMVRTMVGLFVSAMLVSMAAFGYVLVLASGTQRDEDVTRNAICAILVQTGGSSKITAEQQARLAADEKSFSCRIARAQ